MSDCPDCNRILTKPNSCQCGWKKGKKQKPVSGWQRCSWVNDDGKQCDLPAGRKVGKWFCTFHGDADRDRDLIEDFGAFCHWMDQLRDMYPGQGIAALSNENAWTKVQGMSGSSFVPGSPSLPKRRRGQMRIKYPPGFEEKFWKYLSAVMHGTAKAPSSADPQTLIRTVFDWSERAENS